MRFLCIEISRGRILIAFPVSGEKQTCAIKLGRRAKRQSHRFLFHPVGMQVAQFGSDTVRHRYCNTTN